jgi:hypothetical protein
MHLLLAALAIREKAMVFLDMPSGSAGANCPGRSGKISISRTFT